jgi:glycosyltransferase involved in cell wall biosynthesis
VLEAMQRGLPVACSASAALPEVVGDAAILFDATSVESIRDALARAMQSEQLRARLKERGSARVRQFTWDAAARSAFRTVAAA